MCFTFDFPVLLVTRYPTDMQDTDMYPVQQNTTQCCLSLKISQCIACQLSNQEGGYCNDLCRGMCILLWFPFDCWNLLLVFAGNGSLSKLARALGLVQE